MSISKKCPAFDGLRGQRYDEFNSNERIVDRPDNASTIDAQNFAYTEDRQIGVNMCCLTNPHIFAATGSVGIYIMLWIIGGFLTFCGLSVFLEFGLAIPRSGGEKNHLERIYRYPQYLVTCVLASQMILLGSYYVIPVVGVGVSLFGAVYWFFCTKVFPRIGGYRVLAERRFDGSEVETVQHRKIPVTGG
ncbi:hypothetical protein ACHAPU_001407 [Fusarium lateritium]